MMAVMELAEPIVYTREVMTEGNVHAVAGGTAAVFSARCPGKDTDCEDAAALIPFRAKEGVLVVADGVGGHAGGALAASLAVQALSDSVQATLTENGSLRDAILNGFENANNAVNAIGVGAATTLTVVEIEDGAMRPYHAGDSMILLVGQRGKVRLQTISHSPVGYAVESGLLEASEAMHHEDRHIVSNMVGGQDMRIEIGWKIPMQLRDTLILATDGLFDNLHIEEIVELSRKGPLEQVVASLATRSLARMKERKKDQPSKPDDLTFIAYRRAVLGSKMACG